MVTSSLADPALLIAICCSRRASSIGLVGGSSTGFARTITFAPVGDRSRRGAGFAGNLVGRPEPPWVFSTTTGTGIASAVGARLGVSRGIWPIRLRGVVAGSNCGRISWSSVAAIAPGTTNTKVVPHCAASALLSIAEAPCSWNISQRNRSVNPGRTWDTSGRSTAEIASLSPPSTSTTSISGSSSQRVRCSRIAGAASATTCRAMIRWPAAVTRAIAASTSGRSAVAGSLAIASTPSWTETEATTQMLARAVALVVAK